MICKSKFIKIDEKLYRFIYNVFHFWAFCEKFGVVITAWYEKKISFPEIIRKDPSELSLTERGLQCLV